MDVGLSACCFTRRPECFRLLCWAESQQHPKELCCRGLSYSFHVWKGCRWGWLSAALRHGVAVGSGCSLWGSEGWETQEGERWSVAQSVCLKIKRLEECLPFSCASACAGTWGYGLRAVRGKLMEDEIPSVFPSIPACHGGTRHLPLALPGVWAGLLRPLPLCDWLQPDRKEAFPR